MAHRHTYNGKTSGIDKPTSGNMHTHSGLEPAKAGAGHTHKVKGTNKKSSGPIPA